MSKNLKFVSSRIGLCIFIVFLILVNDFNIVMSKTHNSIIFPPVGMQGVNFVPEDDSKWVAKLSQKERLSFTAQPYYLSRDLSDWEQLEFLTQHKLKKVRIFMIGDKDKYIDVTLKDSKVCKKIATALDPRYIFRPAVSDIGRIVGGYGGGASLGVLQLHFKGVKLPVIIGVAKIGFYLGKMHGSNRQLFNSKALAVALSQVLKQHTEYRVSTEVIEKQSSGYYFDIPKELLGDK